MGFFDFLAGGPDAQLKRHVKRVGNLNSQSEDRQLSAEWLAENGSDEAILGLLGRFSVNYEQRMKDAKEKEHVYGLLLGLGPRAVAPLRQWILGNAAFAMPFNAFEHHAGEDAAIDLLVEVVATEKDPFKTEKKRQALLRLAEYDDPRVIDAAGPALQDFDEGVRYAAVECLLKLEGHQDRVAPLLLEALARPGEESNRLRVRIAEQAQRRGWSLDGVAAAIAAHPPAGWTVDGGRLRPA
jgi:hypothetical protein